MRIKILTSSALINQERGRWAGLAEEVDAPRERAEYLISVGAAKALDDDDDPDDKDEDEVKEPEKKPEPEPKSEPEKEPEPKPVAVLAPEKKAAPAPVTRRPAPKTK